MTQQWVVSLDISKAVLARAKEVGALKLGEFALSSGQKSSYYFDCRLLSLDQKGAGLLAKAVLLTAKKFGAEAIGGPTIGAVPIMGSSLGVASTVGGVSLKGFFVRSEAKGHGMQKQVEGPLKPGMRVMVLDDVCSTGSSLLRSIQAVEAMKCKMVCVFTVLDRHQGGSDKLRERGYPFVTLLETNLQGNVRIVGQ